MFPKPYDFIDRVGPLPKALEAALKYYGIKEVPGQGSNTIILQMAKYVGVDDIYNNDDVSWCALFVNNALKEAGKPMVGMEGNKWNLLRALWMTNWGNPVKIGEEKLGDVMIFSRPGGGHVGFYIAESKKTFHVYGGNQGNKASFTEIAKTRLVATRNLYTVGPPASAKKYFIDSSGKISANET